jgi:hypothetical protein
MMARIMTPSGDSLQAASRAAFRAVAASTTTSASGVPARVRVLAGRDQRERGPRLRLGHDRVSLAGAEAKLAQLDQMARRAAAIHLGMPAFGEMAGRTTLSNSKDRP